LIADDPGSSAGNKKKLVNNPTPDYHVFKIQALQSQASFTLIYNINTKPDLS